MVVPRDEVAFSLVSLEQPLLLNDACLLTVNNSSNFIISIFFITVRSARSGVLCSSSILALSLFSSDDVSFAVPCAVRVVVVVVVSDNKLVKCTIFQDTSPSVKGRWDH
jgi:hypothetical protein